MEKDPDDEFAKETQGFDKELINLVKSGFKPLFVGNPHATIYQSIPSNIFDAKPQVFLPRSVCLGLNWSTDSVYPTAEINNLHISAHMYSILTRNPNISFEDYIRAMNAMREEIKACHFTIVTVDLPNLISLVLSCCHILDVLILFHEGRLTPQVDQICSSGIQTLWVDFLPVKNQVPFFALQRIYDMVILDKSQYPPLVNLCLGFFEHFLDVNYKQTPPLDSKSIYHLLHLVHYHLVPSNNPPKTQGLIGSLFDKTKSLTFSRPPPQLPIFVSPPVEQMTMKTIPSARRLQEAGIKFRKKKTPGFSNITFHRGVLEIPFLRLDSNTETLLRNFTAWEQFHFTVGAYFTSYAIFMDYIINVVEDVQILNREGILEQTLGSEEQVASLFNGLSSNLVYIGEKDGFLPHLSKELNRYCRNRFNLWRAKLKVDYFSSPWATIYITGAILALLMTATQTFFSAYSYYRPH
ncbi:UPF0481 protein At3g47200-like [Aristolochia californica]|uniref:UPF0481 protein At3g47200-like n=1 Tax=Aristolochia californica TaxID=171875 RepID=UPI0035E3285B